MPEPRPRRLGGELPLGCDTRLAHPWGPPPGVVAFSSGRSALAWLIESRGPFAIAAVSAYTCPSVPRFLRRRNTVVRYFDHLAPPDAVAASLDVPDLPALVLLPAFLGLRPWLDAAALAKHLGPKVVVVVDAAQSAFAALEWTPPPGGAVLSAPRKTVAVGDGAFLALDGLTEAEAASAAALPSAPKVAADKQRARQLFAEDDDAHEQDALALAQAAEAAMAEVPQAPAEESLHALRRIDPDAHAARRRANFAHLADRLRHVPMAVERPETWCPGEVPFSLPILHDDRGPFLARLRERRIFATALWPDAEHDPTRHPRAADLARRMVSLPIDQRCDDAAIDTLATEVLACL